MQQIGAGGAEKATDSTGFAAAVTVEMRTVGMIAAARSASNMRVMT
jgi:hypothetical protein